ncbi:TIGR01621 family pseudouridine synthase [Balneatrix alpica]|uniref:TIGR01621 family pseudouridine synthase n=1 Tax=Balneatrix alpica TaxID=75684 RepID=A0ABV5Z7T6_9GAMM|nr:TIGR01621 family pseudouridine synthase [Balneatrix alpica]
MYTLVVDHPDFIVIDKSANVSFHSENDTPGLVYTLQQDLNNSELYPLHRLDKVTSGLLLFGKNKSFAQTLGDAFANHQVQKLYLALSTRKPNKKQGWIKGDMQRSRRSSWMLTPSMNNPAITQFSSLSLAPGLRAFWLYPQTGKTHQLRVALRSIGAPILGDTLYGGKANEADRTYLHATALGFSWQGQVFQFKRWPSQGQHFQQYSWADTLAPDTYPWQQWLLTASQV